MTAQSQVLKIRRPDDWHIHLRDGDMLKTVVPYTSEIYGRAIVMPNLAPPVTTVDAAIAYRQRILDAVRRQQGDASLTNGYRLQVGRPAAGRKDRRNAVLDGIRADEDSEGISIKLCNRHAQRFRLVSRRDIEQWEKQQLSALFGNPGGQPGCLRTWPRNDDSLAAQSPGHWPAES